MDTAAPSCPVVPFDHLGSEWTEPTLRPLYAELHASALSRSDRHGGFWIVGRHADVKDLELRTGEFSCARDGVTHPRQGPPGFRALAPEQDPPARGRPATRSASCSARASTGTRSTT